jgi:hypothetical protein
MKGTVLKTRGWLVAEAPPQFVVSDQNWFQATGEIRQVTRLSDGQLFLKGSTNCIEGKQVTITGFDTDLIHISFRINSDRHGMRVCRVKADKFVAGQPRHTAV